jgi:holo-[acyl-carrier protein] synthase
LMYGDHMETLGIGIDLVEINRIERAMMRHDDFVSRIFSQRERELCEDCSRPARRYAACFAAKEAASKALGTGVRGFSWSELEVLKDPGGKPILALSGKAREEADLRGVGEILISLSHSRGLAVAVAQAVSPGEDA